MLWKPIGPAAGAAMIGALITVQANGSQESLETEVAAVYSDAGVRMSRVRLNTGVELQVAESGPTDGDPVLFLHGFTDSWFSFSPILDKLSPNIRAIVPTHRGHGDSERPRCCYRMEDFAADAVALMDALGIERASVVGHSMGSFVAQRIAIDHPDRVHRLVLIGSGATGNTEAVRAFSDVVQTLPDIVALDFIREFQQSTAVEPLPETFLNGVVRETSKLPGWLWRDALAGILAMDAEDELHRIQASTLIVWGVHDELMLRADQDALLRAIPRARLLSYPDMGHSPNWEQPARFAADLNEFLSTTEPADASRAG